MGSLFLFTWLPLNKLKLLDESPIRISETQPYSVFIVQLHRGRVRKKFDASIDYVLLSRIGSLSVFSWFPLVLLFHIISASQELSNSIYRISHRSEFQKHSISDLLNNCIVEELAEIWRKYLLGITRAHGFSMSIYVSSFSPALSYCQRQSRDIKLKLNDESPIRISESQH